MAITISFRTVAANITQAWDAEKVFAALLDRQYEGVATKGNTVHIPGVVAPAIKDYKANNRTTSADAITDTGVDLLIDQEKNFDFKVDDIDAAQSAGSLAPYTDAAGKALVDDADKFIATMLAAGATNLSGSAPDTGNKAFDLVKAARVALNKKNAPPPAEFSCATPTSKVCSSARIRSSPASMCPATTTASATAPSAPSSVPCAVVEQPAQQLHPGFVAFHPEAAAYVSQLDKVEALRADNSFADRLRGLHVYGGKVVRPDGVVKFGMTSGS
ncbi:hypothetical protein [Gordonia westfalica]|uniref:P22 coat protein-gene protein 5 n=1 Tax=Gordonia westfalica TaxID=158898 RepID=A0A1H2EHW9_9ACTN|nr:hypothetical protein [Gordonia westfalica]SDT94681.1 hypothetical protein SAMN04488548_1323 [Gordonia westfalica]